VAVGPKDGDGAGEEHRTEVSYQVTRWSNTYSGAGGGMSSQWNWDDRQRSRGCTCVYEIVGKLKCPKGDTHERQVGVESRPWDLDSSPIHSDPGAHVSADDANNADHKLDHAIEPRGQPGELT
jgi:hypothetical protein